MRRATFDLGVTETNLWELRTHMRTRSLRSNNRQTKMAGIMRASVSVYLKGQRCTLIFVITLPFSPDKYMSMDTTESSIFSQFHVYLHSNGLDELYQGIVFLLFTTFSTFSLYELNTTQTVRGSKVKYINTFTYLSCCMGILASG